MPSVIAGRRGDGGAGSQTEMFGRKAHAVTLSKGGSAIRGIGEKFAPSPIIGAVWTLLPVTASPSRSGVSPHRPTYCRWNGGNGPSGLGCSLALSSITRNTVRGPPGLLHNAKSDVFVLPRDEDVTPASERDGERYEDSDTCSGRTSSILTVRKRSARRQLLSVACVRPLLTSRPAKLEQRQQQCPAALTASPNATQTPLTHVAAAPFRGMRRVFFTLALADPESSRRSTANPRRPLLTSGGPVPQPNCHPLEIRPWPT